MLTLRCGKHCQARTTEDSCTPPMHKKMLCLGGSCDPIHHGRLTCAPAVAEGGGFDRVLLIPSAKPPHKPDATDIADAAHRLQMCRLAIETNRTGPQVQFEVSDIEITRA